MSKTFRTKWTEMKLTRPIFIANHNFVDFSKEKKWFGRSCTVISKIEQPPICGPDLK